MNFEAQIFNRFGHPKPEYKPQTGKHGSLDYRYDCPYCLENRGDPDTKGHFFVNNKTGLMHCYRCGFHGKLIQEQPLGEDIIYGEEKEEVDNDQLLEDVSDILSPNSDVFNKLIPITKVLNAPTAKAYMNSRGFSDEQIDEYDMRVGDLGTPLFGYVVIPNMVKHIVKTDMYCARTFLNAEKRYLNPPESAAGKSVFNLHRIPDEVDRLIICEGALNAIASGRNAVALYGKNCSKEKMNLILAKKPKQVVINLDLDAKNKAYELAGMMAKANPELDIKILLIDEEGFKDAADYLKAGKIAHYLELVDNAPKFDPIFSNILDILN